MKIFLWPNYDKPDAKKCTHRAGAILHQIAKRRGQDVVVMLEKSKISCTEAGEDVVYGTADELLADCDIVVPIGGDGTIMRAAQRAARAGKPILGLNAGNLGFLCQLEIDELSELERLFTGQYKIFERMMFKAEVLNGTGQPETYYALNDVVIRHGDSDRIVEIEVRQGGKLIAAYRADGVIFSTPTGSTAYSMSAGGPIVAPELSLILLTAICSHSPFNSSLVLSADHEYTTYEKVFSSQNGMYVSADGVRVGKLETGGSVSVARASTSAQFIDLGLREFFSNLNQKLSWRR